MGGQKKIEIAVSVDRTRDLQIFSLTLSQLSYPRFLVNVVKNWFCKHLLTLLTYSWNRHFSLPNRFYILLWLSVPVLFLISLLLCFFVSLCCSARQRHTETEMGMSFKEEFVFGLFPILYWVLLSPGFVCVYSFCLKRFFLCFESTCRAEIRGITWHPHQVPRPSSRMYKTQHIECFFLFFLFSSFVRGGYLWITRCR